MIKYLLTFLAILLIFCSNAQSGEAGTTTETLEYKKEFRDVLFSPGIIVQHETFLEFNMLIGDLTNLPGKIPIIGVDGIRIGVETNLRDGRNHTIAPKVGYEISATLFVIRLSAVNYFQNGNSEFRILPELGLSIYGWVNLTYGYGIPLHNGNLNNVSCHRVGLSFNLNRRLRDAVFRPY